MYKHDVALNSQQLLICRKTKPYHCSNCNKYKEYYGHFQFSTHCSALRQDPSICPKFRFLFFSLNGQLERQNPLDDELFFSSIKTRSGLPLHSLAFILCRKNVGHM